MINHRFIEIQQEGELLCVGTRYQEIVPVHRFVKILKGLIKNHNYILLDGSITIQKGLIDYDDKKIIETNDDIIKVLISIDEEKEYEYIKGSILFKEVDEYDNW